MLSDNQLITALNGMMKLSTTAKKEGIRLEKTPRSLDDDLMNVNHEFKVLRRGIDTGYYVQIGMGEMSLDFFDGDATTEITRLGKEGLATPMIDFIARVIHEGKKPIKA